ncbi:unnamed protein product [Microthlaspi erraticum]|uniref:Transmembrane protein n=1 Tax=Microthlaspi erraticum TaxID=1685480 RepID=A0A6D2L516_9BRAS|nr:unnamed protein product [Microthlaspi erraticum]
MQRPTKSLSQLPLPHVMEENVENLWTISTFSSHPLFSCFITLYTLLLIYFPNDSLRILLSPVLLISGAFLFSLLLLGSTRELNTRPGNGVETGSVNLEEAEESKVLVSEAKREKDSDTKPNLIGDFVEWNLRAPLEVIHEAYEEDDDGDEEEENQSVSGEKDSTRLNEIERYPSLSLCYPESDSESDSDSLSEFNFPEMGGWISPENMRFRWEEEDDDDGIGLIEIKLDEYEKMSKRNQTELDFNAEEEGLIEIDLFP